MIPLQSKSPEMYRTIMSNELQALGQNGNQLLINQTCNRNAHECSIGGFDLVECARLALLYEFLSRAGLGFDYLGD
jgi:hypothetical protein